MGSGSGRSRGRRPNSGASNAAAMIASTSVIPWRAQAATTAWAPSTAPAATEATTKILLVTRAMLRSAGTTFLVRGAAARPQWGERPTRGLKSAVAARSSARWSESAFVLR